MELEPVPMRPIAVGVSQGLEASSFKRRIITQGTVSVTEVLR